MQLKRNVLCEPGFLLLLFLLGMAFFGWPLLESVAEDSTYRLYIYLFAVWAVLVAALYLASRALRKCNDRGGG